MNKNSKKILVVDDDPVIVKLVEELLLSHGYEVATAKDGLDCMVFLQKEKPALIVLDIMMPEINGYDVCHNIKFNSDFKEIPILILTTRDQELDPRIGQMIGIEYLQKPLERALFLKKVEDLLRESE